MSEKDCQACEESNVPNAVYGIAQMVMCDENDLETVEEAVELVEKRADEYLNGGVKG